MRTLLIALGLALTMTACVSRETQARRDAAQAVQYEAQQDATCRSYGTQPRTPLYVQCRLQLQQQDATQRAAVQQMLLGRALTPAPAPYQLPVPK